MGKIKVTHDCNGIEGLKVIEPVVFGDARGYFMETYNYNDLRRQELTASSYRITSLPQKKVCSGAYISRSTIRRINWFEW